MYAKNIIILAVASLAADVLAVNVHRHGHGQVHQNQKKDMKVETEFATVTEWVTVTYDPNAPTSTANRKFEAATHSKDYSRKYSTQSSSSSSSSSVSVAAVETSSVPSVEPTPSSSSIVQVPTTLATLTKPVEAVKVAPTIDIAIAPTIDIAIAPTIDIAVAAPTTSAAPAPASSSPEAAVPAPSGGNKRMLAYNDPGLLSGFLGTNSKVGAKYNWGQVDDSASQAAVPFAPMLWSPAHADTWQSNADKAIAAGAKALLSFNEPDNAGQANMDPASAAAAHIKYMNPYKGKIPISTPAITNSNNAGEGISWLKAFISACNGQCAFDFIACHWYSDYNDLLQHLKDVHVAGGGLPVWLTEFAPIGGSIDPNSFVAEITHELDTNPDYSFVKQYAYFMVSDGTLTSGGQPNTLGQTFAFSS